MSKLDLTLIQHILGIMQETLPVLSRVDANLHMQYKTVLQSLRFFSATDKWGVCVVVLWSPAADDEADVIMKHSHRK